MNKGFSFKKFHVNHDKCAMKVGTDAVLLGGLTPVESCYKVLDMGTGSGVVALMLAQRNTEMIIDAVEIEINAAKQADENFKASPFANRLNISLASHQAYSKNHKEMYDLVISNPPFFRDAQGIINEQRSLARSLRGKTHIQWFESAHMVLKNGGLFYLILPYNELFECLEKEFNVGEPFQAQRDENNSFYLLCKSNITLFDAQNIARREDVGNAKSEIYQSIGEYQDSQMIYDESDKHQTWQIQEITYISPSEGKKCNRVILGLRKIDLTTELESTLKIESFANDICQKKFMNLANYFTIRTEANQYSEEMRQLISPFYLKY